MDREIIKLEKENIIIDGKHVDDCVFNNNGDGILAMREFLTLAKENGLSKEYIMGCLVDSIFPTEFPELFQGYQLNG